LHDSGQRAFLPKAAQANHFFVNIHSIELYRVRVYCDAKIEPVIKTILFDLGNVIVPFDFKRAYAKLGPLCNCEPVDIPARIRSTDLVTRFETGCVGPKQFVEELSAVLGLKIAYAEFCDLWTCIFLPETLVAEPLLQSLASRYRLMILSNTNPIHFDMVKANYPLLRHFHDYVLSHEAGAVKPSSKIFQAAIQRAQCKPEECFFTDDIPINIEAARKHGMDAVQFQSAAQLEDELRVRKIEF
jgi:glucose-1-phosphatase